MSQFQVSQSKVKVWLRCRQAYWYRYVEKLKKRVKSRPLVFGTIMHDLLEAYANGNDWKKVLRKLKKEQGNLFAAEREEYGDILEDCRLIFEAYLEYYGSDKLRYILYSGQRAEHWIEVELPGDIKFVMKIDAFARTPNKLRWLVENKTGKAIPDVDDRWRNLQTSSYYRGAEMYGIKPFDGVLWNFVRSKAPSVPQLLKGGGLSIKAIDTLPAVVRATIKQHGLKLKDNQVLLERAAGNLPRYFERQFTPRNEQTIDLMFQDFVSTAQEMQDLHGKRKQKTIDKHCSWCDFEKLCRAELTGGDLEYLKEREYAVGDKKEAGRKKKVKQPKSKTKSRRKKAS